MGTFDSAAFLKTVSTRPGVYRMLGRDDAILYIGKAKNLRKRLSSYFRKSVLEAKTLALVERIEQVEVTITHTETEALLLEQTLIKQHRPPYNIVLRDDKSYPYVYLSRHAYPMLALRRGRRAKTGTYFGPYPGATAVRESVHTLQKVFQLRSCEDSYFSNRSRPCLQHQIKRCSAPCVGRISAEEYAADVKGAVMFLEGRSSEVVQSMAERMDAHAEALEYEQAAELRDRIVNLRRVQEQQTVVKQGGDMDVIACAVRPGGVCAQAVFIRGGRVLGSKNWYPSVKLQCTPAEVLSEFLPQFYLDDSGVREIPAEVLLAEPVEDQELLEQALGERAGHRVRIATKVRGKRAAWVRLAQTNAEQSLGALLAGRQNMLERFESLAEGLQLASMPARIECFDISHSAGELPQASCVVFGLEGPIKADYRRFNIENITAGDDYAAMRQAVSRRYKRIQKGEGKLPDVLFIDGGKGQVNAALEALEEAGVEGLLVVGVAKGAGRRDGLETLLRARGEGRFEELALKADFPGLHLIQHLRDEAHRFAITGHRGRRDRKRSQSPLEGVAGIGPRRRRDLLRHFGGLQEVTRASVEDLARAPGISPALAADLYAALHGDAST